MSDTGHQKIIYFALTAFMLLFLMCALSGCAASLDPSSSGRSPVITADKAAAYALDDANVKAVNMTLTSCKLQYDSNDPVYYITFTTERSDENITYEYRVSGDDGKILYKDKQIQSTSSVYNNNEHGEIRGDNIQDVIGVEKAKRAVLDDAGLSGSDVLFRSVRLMTDHDRFSYITEFTSQGIHYEFILDAVSGKILSREVQYSDKE